MRARPGRFSSAMRKTGDGRWHAYGVYDALDVFAAARVWWTLRAFRRSRRKDLEGCLPKWLGKDGRSKRERPRATARIFSARLDHSVVASLDDVSGKLASAQRQVVHARPANVSEAKQPRTAGRTQERPTARQPESAFVDM